jgi:hypothetical protein
MCVSVYNGNRGLCDRLARENSLYCKRRVRIKKLGEVPTQPVLLTIAGGRKE